MNVTPKSRTNVTDGNRLSSATVPCAAPAAAGLPWDPSFHESILGKIQNMASIFATIAIVVACCALMFGEAAGMSRRTVGVLLGSAAIFGVASVTAAVLESGAGVLF